MTVGEGECSACEQAYSKWLNRREAVRSNEMHEQTTMSFNCMPSIRARCRAATESNSSSSNAENSRTEMKQRASVCSNLMISAPTQYALPSVLNV